MPQARRAPVHLTDFKVRALKPDSGEYIQGDLQVPGLGVRVRPSGAMSYVVMKRLPGQTKPTRITLGRVGDLSLQDARDKAREAIAATRQGVRVNVEKRRERTIARRVEKETGYPPGTFGETAEDLARQHGHIENDSREQDYPDHKTVCQMPSRSQPCRQPRTHEDRHSP